jgi:hypothetical protein
MAVLLTMLSSLSARHPTCNPCCIPCDLCCGKLHLSPAPSATCGTKKSRCPCGRLLMLLPGASLLPSTLLC